MKFFFQAVVISILLYGCTTCTLTKSMEKKLDGNYTILNKSWRQYPTKQQLYSHLPLIRYVGHCWRCKDELISDILLWTSSHGQAKAGLPTRIYIQQLCADTGYSLEDLLEAMYDRVGWQERVRAIRAGSATWWWWHRLTSKNLHTSSFVQTLDAV